MINLFGKLKSEGRLKTRGSLLDLGSGDGAVSLPFARIGYQVTLVDKDVVALEKAKKAFEDAGLDDFVVKHQGIEEYVFEDSFDGIIISGVLPFLVDKNLVNKSIHTALENLKDGGFLYFTLFGDRDDWVTERKEKMSFYTKEEALDILEAKPYFFSEDYGQGITRKGDAKTWHIFSFLYLKP